MAIDALSRPTIAQFWVDGNASKPLNARGLNAMDGGMKAYGLKGTFNDGGTTKARIVISQGFIHWGGSHTELTETIEPIALSSTTYVYYANDSAGAGGIRTSTTAYPGGKHFRIATVTTSASGISAVTDDRPLYGGDLVIVQFGIAGTITVGSETQAVIPRKSLLIGWTIGAVAPPSGGPMTFDIQDSAGTTVLTDTADRISLPSTDSTADFDEISGWTGTQPNLVAGLYSVECMAETGTPADVVISLLMVS
jgi:hypothetical protein